MTQAPQVLVSQLRARLLGQSVGEWRKQMRRTGQCR
jgi:hypothetical protein